MPPKRKSSASVSRFAPCPICSKSIALFRMNEHLDEHASADAEAPAQVNIPSATPLTQPAPRAQPATAAELHSACGESLTAAHTAHRPTNAAFARIFGHSAIPAPAAAPPTLEQAACASQVPSRLAQTSFMAGYINQLHDRVYPGAGRHRMGGVAHIDPRRQNSWVGGWAMGGASAEVRAARAAHTLGEVLGAAKQCSTLLGPEEVGAATRFGELSANAQLVCAQASRAAGAWVALEALEAPRGGSSADAEVHEAGVPDVRWASAVEEAVAAGFVVRLDAAACVPSRLADLQPLLTSALPLRTLRQLAASYSISISLPSTSPAQSQPRAAGTPPHTELVAAQIVNTLRRRRGLDPMALLASLLASLGPCVSMRPAVVCAVRRCSLVFFCAAGFAADEVAGSSHERMIARHITTREESWSYGGDHV